MLRSNGKIKKLSMFLIASFFLSFLAGEVNAIRDTCDRHEDDRRTCRRRHYRHHSHHHRRRHSYLHQCKHNHHHRYGHHHHHRRHIERPGAAPVKKVVIAPRKCNFGLRRKVETGDKTFASQRCRPLERKRRPR
ncbi:MAG: hypothetical protein K2X28_06505 [Alphaproteobacteria bacterium]|nr:hypothetical protein [Alphaproteobacteria bacterium]